MHRAAEPRLSCDARRPEPDAGVCARVCLALRPATAGVLLGLLALGAHAQPEATAQAPIPASTSRAVPAPTSTSGPLAGTPVTNPHAAKPGQVPPGFDPFTPGSRLRPVDFVVRWGQPAAETEDLRVPRRRGENTAWHDPATGLLHHQHRGYREPGVRALVGRPQFVALVGPGGEISADTPRIEVAGANTVFQLTPERRAQAPRQDGPPPVGLLNTQLKLRVTQPAGTRRLDEALGVFTPTPAAWRRVRNGPVAEAPQPTAVPVRAAGRGGPGDQVLPTQGAEDPAVIPATNAEPAPNAEPAATDEPSPGA